MVLLAPTGRAATVLKSKTGLEARTIHGEIYSFKDIEGEASESEAEPVAEDFGQMRLLFDIRQPDSDDSRVYIVDEASMVSDLPGDPTSYAHFGSGNLLGDFMKIAGANKIIFSGDPSQLPPVGCNDSPALTEAWFRKKGFPVSGFELSEIMRHKRDSGILTLATRVRKLTTDSNLPQWVKLPARGTPQVSLHAFDELKEEFVKSVLGKEKGNSIAICHSNQNCLDINKKLRQELYGNPLAPLHPGDQLIVTQNNHLVPFANGDFGEIIERGQELAYLRIRFVPVTVRSQLTGEDHETLLCVEPLYNGKANLHPEQQRQLMIDFSCRMRKKRIKPKSETYHMALQKDPYLNSLRANFGHAITCQKSQGGEWNDVFLFLQRGMYVFGAEQLTRWWYTGITRAKEKLCIADDWWIS